MAIYINFNSESLLQSCFLDIFVCKPKSIYFFTEKLQQIKINYEIPQLSSRVIQFHIKSYNRQSQVEKTEIKCDAKEDRKEVKSLLRSLDI